MANENRVIDLIQKLLAVQEGRGATEAEAEQAAAHVQRLLQEHNLSLSEVEHKANSQNEVKRSVDKTGHRAMYEYQRMLMAGLAETHFCLHVIRRVFIPRPGKAWAKSFHNGQQGQWSKQHILVGRDLNVRVTVSTYEYLAEALLRALNAAGIDGRTKDGYHFLEGAATRIVERLQERRREAEIASKAAAAPAQASGSDRELVLSDVYGTEADLNNDALNGYPAGTTVANRRKHEAREIEREAEMKRLQAEGVEWAEAWYRSQGYSEERAKVHAEAYRRSGSRGGGRNRHSTRNWSQSNDRHYEKINSASYQAGRVAGNHVGLDSQVGAASRAALPKK